MKSIFFPSSYNVRHPLRVRWLLIIWLVGLVLGIILSMSYPVDSADIRTTIREGSSTPATAFLLTGICMIVALVSVGANMPILGYLLVFAQGACRGFSALLVYQLLGSGAWLVRFFLLFSVSGTSVLIFWLLIRHCQGRRASFAADVCLISVLLLTIVLCDVLFVSPFLSGIV